MFQKAWAGLELSPAQRALLKTLQSLLIGAFVVALFAASQYFAGTGSVNVAELLRVMGIAFTFAFMHGLAKLVTASYDAQLGEAIEAVTSEAEKKWGPTPPKPIELPPLQGRDSQ